MILPVVTFSGSRRARRIVQGSGHMVLSHGTGA
jgi:hypothetical protein